jgi:hypothetical protein
MARRVIVDENAGPGTEIWEQAQQVFADQQWDYVYLAKSHRGIPDVEILDKLLRPGAVLLAAPISTH